ncbi:MAG: o-succinylbenzoate synthase [Balneolaceae bacterium]
MLQYFKYRLPFKQTFTVFGNEIEYREGIILVYREGKITAYGEAAPLPGFSIETLEQVETVLKVNHAVLQQGLQNNTAAQIVDILNKLHNFPSLSFGLDTLMHDFAAKKEQKTLAEYLFLDGINPLHSNAILPFQSIKNTLEKAEDFANQGFETFKVKVGENFSREAEVLRLLRKQYPHIKIRIDANQAWQVEEAISSLRSIESLQIEYCEQPVSGKNFKGLRKVKKSTTIPIAADESIRNKNDVIPLLKAEAIDMLILKPSLFGTFKNLFVTKSMADSHNIETVFTTSLESTVARAAIAVLASGLGSPEFAQGLGTGNLFKYDVGQNNWLNKPVIQLPKTPGLGISVDLDSLEEIKE